MDYSTNINNIFFLYAPSHKKDSTYHGLYHTICGAMAGTRHYKNVMSAHNRYVCMCVCVCVWEGGGCVRSSGKSEEIGLDNMLRQ